MAWKCPPATNHGKERTLRPTAKVLSGREQGGRQPPGRSTDSLLREGKKLENKRGLTLPGERAAKKVQKKKKKKKGKTKHQK